jgi:trigger factor
MEEEMKNFSKKAALFAAVGSICFAAGCQSKTLEVTYDYEAADYVSVGEYKNLQIEVEDYTVTDADVQNAVDQVLEQNMEYVTVERAAQEGDMVILDFDAYISGSKVEGFSGEDYEVYIGEGSFLVDGFEEALIGLSAGEKRAITGLYVPEDFTTEEKYAGRAITYNIEIKSVNEPVLPTYDDEFVENFTEGSFKTVDEYNSEIRSMLEENAVTNAYNAKYNALFEQILNNTEVKKEFPEEYIEKKKEIVEEQVSKFALIYNLTDKEYLSQYFGYDTVEEVAYNQILTEFIYQYIIETEDITITQKYYKDNIDATAESRGYSSADKFISTNGENAAIQCMQLDKAIELIMDSAVVTTK